MKKARLLALTLGAALTAGSVGAVDTTPYKCGFGNAIDTSNNAFKAASNWSHIVDSYTDDYGSEYFMTYSYLTSGGIDDSACLKAMKQEAGDYWDNGTVYDLLVTPLVKGTVSMKANMNAGYTGTSAWIEVYSITADGKKGDLIKRFSSSDMGSTPNTWVTITLPDELADYQHLGLRLQYVSIDDFEATSADITPEASLAFASVEPTATTGTIYWDEQPNHKVKITFNVSVTNTGEVDLTTDMENYSITVFNNNTKTDLFTVAVPVDLTVGATSEVFEVSGEVDPTAFGYNYGTPIHLREDLSNGVIKRAQSIYREYAPKFVLRAAGSTSTSSMTTPVAFGMVSEPAVKKLEIYNDGNAPLTVTGITLPDGFSSANLPAGQFILNAGETQPFTIAVTATPGAYSGDITMKYLKKDGTEDTKTLAISATVIASGTWTCDFGTSSNQFPEGSIADSGISTDYTGSNYYIKGSTYNNHFITPLLHAAAGDVFSFETARDSYSSSSVYSLKVYASSVRGEWGDPVMTLTADDITNNTFELRQFTIAEEGDYYLMFELANGRVDNLAGFSKAEVPYDIYFKTIGSPETKQNGETLSFDITAIAPVSIPAVDYTIELVSDGTVIARPASVDLTASAKNEVMFHIDWTPDVETTTVFNLVARATFTDGSSIESAPKQLTITNQPDFVFFNKGDTFGTYYKPNNRTAPITFGMTNETGVPQEFDILNWGTAPLTVTSITVPDGFSVNVSEATIAAKERQTVAIAISTEEPGTYSGNLTIKYLDLNNEEQTFELPVSATLLDTTKWYATINRNAADTGWAWPNGTVRTDSNLSATTVGYNPSVYAMYSYNNSMLISPKLHAEENEVLSINAQIYGSYYTNGYVNIYTAATREGLSNEEERTLVARLSGQDVEADRLVTEVWNVKNIEMPAGDYFVGFELGNRLYVNYIYGLTPVSKDADLVLAGSDIPDAAMQNNQKNMYVKVYNYGMKEAESYTAAAFVNGEKVSEIAVNEAIPVHYTTFETALAIPVPVRYPKAGTFPVYLQITYGDQVLTTEPVEVTFSEEVFSSEKQVGEVFASQPLSSDVPVKFYDKNSEAIMLFNAEDLQLNEGDKISDIRFRGYCNSSRGDFQTNIQFYYQWTSDQTQEQPADGLFDPAQAGMTAAINDTEQRTWSAVQGSKDELTDMIVLHFDEPLVYENGKSLRIYAAHWDASNYMSSSTYGYERTELTRNAFYHSHDNKQVLETGSSKSWKSAPLPVIYLSLAVEPVTLTGTVTDNGEAVEGAAVTLVSTDGDNVQYTGTTAADGTYSIKVIQNSRAYDVTAATDSKEDFLLDQLFTENASRDFSLLDVVEIDNTVGAHAANGQAVVKLNLDLEAGYNTVVLPFSLTADEARALFGDDCEVLYFGKSELAENGDLRMWFGHEDENKGIVAGKPYVVNMFDSPAATRYRGKAVITETAPVADSNVSFNGTYEAKALEDGIFLLNSGNFVPAAANARAASGIAPYSAYVKALNPAVKNVTFTVDDNVASAIEEINADLFNENDVIYNLQGVRVSNPEKGIYIVNGRKVMVK